MLVVTNLDTFRVRTNAAGLGGSPAPSAILRNMSWHAVYLGSDTDLPACRRRRARSTWRRISG